MPYHKAGFNQQGFTLLELLIALAVMALIGVGSMVLLNKTNISKQIIENNGERLNEIERAWLFIGDDIEQLAIRFTRDQFGDRQPPIIGNDQSGSHSLRLSRLGRRNPANLPRSNLELLIYQVTDGQLQRISFLHPDGMTEEQGLVRNILTDISRVEFSYYDGEQWQSSWPPLDQSLNNDQEVTNNNSAEQNSSLLPNGIKVVLSLEDYGDIERLFVVSEPEVDLSL